MLDLTSIIIGAVVFGLALLARILGQKSTQRPKGDNQPQRVCVVLGSGGHTSEMMGFLSLLPTTEWTSVRPFYVVSATDKDSQGFAERFESPNGSGNGGRKARVIKIPRAREVGQSYFTSIFTTLRALGTSFSVVMAEKPHVVLCNGPGVCIPIVAASWILGAIPFLGVPKARTAYLESFTCVDHLSLSGKILRFAVDAFTVSWPQLFLALKPNRSPNLLYVGPFANKDISTSPKEDSKVRCVMGAQEGKSPLAVVTVGSTCFDTLIKTVDSPSFLQALAKQGISEVLIQTGRTNYKFQTEAPKGLSLNVTEYKNNLAAEIQKASLLISHAGAGTILEAMRSNTRTIVTPNEQLMSNHQLQLAKSLEDKQLLFYVPSSQLATKISSLDWSKVKCFPPPNRGVITEVLRQVIQ